MTKVLDINDLLWRMQEALAQCLYLNSITDKNTFIDETLGLKIEQAKTYNKIYASAEGNLPDGYIKEDIQQIAMESLTELETSVQKILSTLNKQNQKRST